MNDRQRLEAIVAVVRRYLPPDGISREDAMREIIELVDPLPEQAEKQAATIEDNSQDWAKLDGAVAWHLIERHADNWADVGKMMDEYVAAKLAKREWGGLTDDEILDLWISNHKDAGATDAFARAIEAKLKEKNT